MNRAIRKNHILLESQNDIATIGKTLNIYLDVRYFHFRRTFSDGSYLILATKSEWPLYFIEKNIAVKTPVSYERFNSNSYFSLWQGNIPDQTLADAKNFYRL